MWYNRVVMNNDNEILREKYYVNKNDLWSIEEEYGIDVMGNFVIEFWSEE